MFKYTFVFLFLLAGALGIVQCDKTTPVNTMFKKIDYKQSGIQFSNTLPDQLPDGMNIIQYLYYYNGGGVAAGDLNNDGWVDLYFTANVDPNTLYWGKGTDKNGNPTFEDGTNTSGTGGTGSWKTGVTLADVNADGWLDIYVCQVGNYKKFKGRNQLFINQKDGTFKDLAAAYGLDFCGFSTQAVFFDVDLDQDLDCYLLNHSVHSPESYKDTSISRKFDPMASDRLYRNDGNHFTDITQKAGICDGKSGYGLGVSVSDLNADGYPDIYVAQDFHENDFIYYNIGGQYFKEGITESVGHTSNFSMGCDIADFNNDALPDIITLDMKPEDEVLLKKSQPSDQYAVYQYKHGFGYHWQFPRNALQLNQGSPSNAEYTPVCFSEIAQQSGVATTDWSWSALFADFDLDGWKDLHITNGIARRPNDNDYLRFLSTVSAKDPDLTLIQKMPLGEAVNYMFKNNKNLGFQPVGALWGLTEVTVSHGAVTVDLDNDGDQDLVVNNQNQMASIYRNDVVGHSLKVKLQGASSNPFGLGAKLKVYQGNRIQYVEHHNVRGFQSSQEPGTVYFGLGDQRIADSVVCIWPDGKKTVLAPVTQGQIAINYADAKVVKKKVEPVALPWFAALTPSGGERVIPDAAVQFANNKLLPWALFSMPDSTITPHDAPWKNNPHLQLVLPCDYDLDGDLDYFTSDRYADGAYGVSANSALWQNNQGQYSVVNVPALNKLGGYTVAVWSDLNGDKRPDLAVGGTWMPVTIFCNLPNRFEAVELPQSSGLWFSLHAVDTDADGDLDLVAGNLGQNTTFRASPEAPLGLLVKDFDGNGSFDPIITHYKQGKNYPFADRDQLTDQMPSFKKEFLEYRKYAERTVEHIFTEEMKKNTIKHAVSTLESSVFENLGNAQWTIKPLPFMAQSTPVFAICSADFNHDGQMDLLLGGNLYEVMPAIGRFDAGFGCMLKGIGGGQFEYVTSKESGIWLRGAVRALSAKGDQIEAVLASGKILRYQYQVKNIE